MNREIKFRGISIDEWVYGMLCKVNEGDTEHGEPIKYKIQTDEKEYGEYVKCFITNEESIGQFTELYDKNEKEIWENDIVEITREGIYEKGIIIFKNGCFFIKSKENLLALYNCELNNYKVKVIGNITDNPELLGGE